MHRIIMLMWSMYMVGYTSYTISPHMPHSLYGVTIYIHICSRIYHGKLISMLRLICYMSFISCLSGNHVSIRHCLSEI